MAASVRIVTAVLLLGAVACSSDDGGGGTSVPDATPDAALTSTAFGEGGEIPARYGGCPPGENVSPDLAWTRMPVSDADQYAVTMVDTDIGFVHWVVVGLAPDTQGLAEGEVPAGAVEAMNDHGDTGYFGPCPPEPHTYVFSVHALGGDPGVTAGEDGGEALAAVEAVSVAHASLTGTFTP